MGDATVAEVERLERYLAAIAAIDAANADDPAVLVVGGEARGKEQTHAEMMTAWVLRLRPAASEELLLAARGHHLRRWMVPRGSFPAGRGRLSALAAGAASCPRGVGGGDFGAAGLRAGGGGAGACADCQGGAAAVGR